jgi:hypothetical protein
MRGKLADVLHRGGAEGIDRLGVVPHHGQARAGGTQLVDDLRLQRIGVLVFIDQHVVEQLADGRSPGGIAQQRVPVQQQVVVIQRGGGFLAIDVGAEQPGQLVRPVAAPGKRVGQHPAELQPGVDAAAVDIQAGPLVREPLLGLDQPQFGADHAHQVLGVAAVEDRELARQSDRLAEAPQEPGGDGVERAAPGPLAPQGRLPGLGLGVAKPPQHAVHAANHLFRRAAGEGQQQDSLRVGAVGDQPSHAVDQGGRLARAGPGDDQQRRAAVADRFALLWIEAGEDLVDRGSFIQWRHGGAGSGW